MSTWFRKQYLTDMLGAPLALILLVFGEWELALVVLAGAYILNPVLRALSGRSAFNFTNGSSNDV